MNKNITFYPVLDATQINEMVVEVAYYFSYEVDGNMIDISSNIERDQYITLDNNSDYDKDENTLIIDVSVNLKKTQILFGPSGIAPLGAEIGLALECFSQKSKYRKVVTSNKTVKYNDESNSCDFKIKIEPKTIQSELSFNLLLTLAKSSGVLLENEFYLNNKSGVIIGTLDKKTLYLSGTGSLFPIYTRPSTDKKLWEVKFEYEDATIDKLSETVQLILNSNHKDYDYLNPKSKNYCDRLIYEIIASAVSLLVVDLKEKGMLGSLKEDYSEGTIMHFVKYCKEVIGIDFSDAMSISSTLRAYLNGED